MTPRNYNPYDDYVRRGDRSDVLVWVLATGAAVLFGFLLLANYSGTSNTAGNNAPNATSNSPPRIGPSTPGSGAQPEKPTPLIHGGPSR